ncbi:MAG: L,D-transpeptidase [Sandaracinus sp.]|nr:L,D-transpeptidase [Sandaracinus sp.]
MRRALFVFCCLALACGPESIAVTAEPAPFEEEPADVVPVTDEAPVVRETPRSAPSPEVAAVPEAPAEPVRDPAAEAAAAARAAREAFEARFPNHGVTFHFLARVRAEPRSDAAVVGYLRRGSRFRASDRVPGVGCARGWHEVPGDGFVCRGEGFLVGREPQTFEPSPLPPSLEDALPYPYAYAGRDDVPQYWRLPSEAEEHAARDAFRAIAQASVIDVDAGVPAAEPDADGVAADVADEVEAPPAPGGADEAQDAPAADPALVAAARGAVELPNFVRIRMRRGFYVSLDGEENVGSRTFARTVRGTYVPADALTPNEPPEHRGVVLGEGWPLPIGFVYRGGTRRLRREAATDRFREDGTFDRLTPFVVAGTLRRGNHGFLVTGDGAVVRRSSVRVAGRHPRPAEIPADARWIHVDLAEQTLVAYEGDRPVFATVTSTGRAGFETPTGLFRIQSKHVSTTMDDLDAGDEAYLIEDVPWTMYFEGNYAIHAAFWHSSYGHVRSHGCINLSPADARWVFGFAGPEVPTSWHGVFATRSRPGSYVLITDGGADLAM